MASVKYKSLVCKLTFLLKTKIQTFLVNSYSADRKFAFRSEICYIDKKAVFCYIKNLTIRHVLIHIFGTLTSYISLLIRDFMASPLDDILK